MVLNENIAQITSTDSRLEWIEPEVHQLDVRETAYAPGSGGDGESQYADCTRS